MKSLEAFLQQKSFQVVFFFAAWVLLFVLYYPAHEALLIDDGISGIWELKSEGLKGFLNSFGFDSFYYGHYAIVFLLYSLFGLNPLGWFLLFTAFHALNAVLLYSFVRKLLGHSASTTQAPWIALCSALLFLVSPYQSENIVWAATSHYAMSLLFLLWMLNKLADTFFSGEPTTSWWVFHGLFALSLVTLEITFLFPLIGFMLWGIYFLNGRRSFSFAQFLLRIAMPQIVLVGIYLLGYWLKTGLIIPHDRAPMEAQVAPSDMLVTLWQQFMKLFGLVHSFEFKTREMLYGFALHWKRMGAFWGLWALSALVWIWFRDKAKWRPALFFLCTGVLLYAPFVRLYFMYLMRFENDRYAYFPSVFLFPFLLLFLFSFPRWFRLIFIPGLMALFVWALQPAIRSRAIAAKIHKTFLNKLPDTGSGNIYLLNVPSYGAETYLFRAESRLPIAYQVVHGKDLFARLKQVAWYNAQTDKDTFVVNRLDVQTFEVWIKTGGSWWMKGSQGLGSYETDEYSLHLGEWGNYTLWFKKPLAPEDLVLYFDGRRFVKVN